MVEETKLCPFCKGEILSIARKCKHCEAMIQSFRQPVVANPLRLNTENQSHGCPIPNWLKAIFILVSIFFAPSGVVIGIALKLNKNPENKSFGTICIVIASIALVFSILTALSDPY